MSRKKIFQECGPSRWGGPLLRNCRKIGEPCGKFGEEGGDDVFIAVGAGNGEGALSA